MLPLVAVFEISTGFPHCLSLNKQSQDGSHHMPDQELALKGQRHRAHSKKIDEGRKSDLFT